MLKAGQTLLINNRRWHLRQVRSGENRTLKIEAIGASAASLGMTRQMTAIQYGDDLFIEQRHRRYWHAHLQRDWFEDRGGLILKCQPATWLDFLATHTRYPASGDLMNEFSWSSSRAAKYGQCPRAYYYHYHAAWEGWQKDAPAPVKRVYLLKNLTDRSRWIGTVVHESIRFAMARVKAGHPLSEAQLIKQLRARVQTDFDDSRSRRYQQQPNQLTGFQEHYYQTSLPKDAWQTAWTKAEQYLRTFINSGLYADLRRQPAASFLDVEELQSFSLAGNKVWVQMDLARREGNTIYIYDWKTGAVDDQPALQHQLGLYGLYIRQAWPEIAAGASLKGIIYALAEDRLLEFDLDETDLQETQDWVEMSMAHIQGLLLDPQANMAEPHRFPMIDNLSVCRQCQFRELCGR